LTHILETGKAKMGMPFNMQTDIPNNVRKIINAVNDILGARGSFPGSDESLTTTLKCVYRVLDSVRTYYDPKDDCSYLKFIGRFLR